MAANNIPLHCNICPKRPNFSDVSHLLTHIASKGHLSNYYKVKVRSAHDDSSRRLIDAYDRWYAEWGVEELMSERMSQKDKRRTRARPTARPTPAPRLAAPAPRPARRLAVGNLLDPRLSEQPVIKLEPLETSGPVLRHRPVVPHLQYWPTESRASSRSYTNPDYETSSEYSDPGERRRPMYTAMDSCAIEDGPSDPIDDPMAVSESTKLKGVYWPGMDIFDSAPPEVRRKRNQKKDSSVVQQLELNSQDVEPIECIFTPRGTFKRQRRISNSEWDDEEDFEVIKKESPQPVKTRSALANVDKNARRSRQMTRPVFPFTSRSQHHDRGRSIFDFVRNDQAPKRKRGFAVYHDGDAEVNFSQPAGMHYLTSAFSHQPSLSPMPTFAPYRTMNETFQYDKKENVFPSFHHTYSNPHGYHGIGYHHFPYAYDPSQEHFGLQCDGHLYGSQHVLQPDQDDDDQRTITAPPSPSTS